MKLLIIATTRVQTYANLLSSPHEIDFEPPAARLCDQIKNAHGYDAVILADGAELLPAEGLTAVSAPLALPRVHNAAALLLGGASAYRALFSRYDGALCWMASGWRSPLYSSPAPDCSCLCYLADTQLGAADESLAARAFAEENRLDFFDAEIDCGLLERLLRGEWESDDILVAAPGKTVRPSCHGNLFD